MAGDIPNSLSDNRCLLSEGNTGMSRLLWEEDTIPLSPLQSEKGSSRQPSSCKVSALVLRCSERLQLKTMALHPLPRNDFYHTCLFAAKLGNASCDSFSEKEQICMFLGYKSPLVVGEA